MTPEQYHTRGALLSIATALHPLQAGQHWAVKHLDRTGDLQHRMIGNLVRQLDALVMRELGKDAVIDGDGK